MSTTRRHMIKTMAALPLLRLPGTDPDLVLYNGLIYTAQPGSPQVTAIAIRDGRFLAVGTDREILALAGKKTRRVDLARQRVFPGFIDAHAHPWASGLDQLKNVACDKTSIEEILAALRARAAETPHGGWVRGYLYDDGKTLDVPWVDTDDFFHGVSRIGLVLGNLAENALDAGSVPDIAHADADEALGVGGNVG